MHELTEGALVAASVDDVWADFTDASRLEKWFWPVRFASVAVVQARELGPWRIGSEVADLAVEGTIVALEPPRALRIEWRWAGEEHATDAEITLTPAVGATTHVVVRHSGFLSEDERESHVDGWSSCLQRLVDRYGGAPGEHL